MHAATRATYIAFIASGFQFASWASRIPQVRDRLHLSPSELGLLLLCAAAGSVLSLPASGPLIAHVGSRRALEITAVISGAGLMVVAVGYQIGVLPVAIGLFAFGYWMAFEAASLRSVRSGYFERLTLQADALRAAYLLLGGFALYATGSYLFRSLTRPAPATAPPPAEPATAEKVVVKLRCLSCRQLNDDDASYCKQCGHAI